MQKTEIESRIKELTDLLNAASKAYYAEDKEIMDNLTYDRLYDELAALEKESGIILSGSPTVNVGYEAVEELPKMEHAYPMLSLDKTKDAEALKSFIGANKTIISWKIDGLTVVLTYRGGSLNLALTRGNGVTGEVVTNNVRVFKDLPVSISFKGELVLRGEAYITYKDFEEINKNIEDVEAKYKNPRNLCSGSVRQLNNRVTAERNVRFKAFSLVHAEGVDFKNSHEEELKWLKSQGFDIVEYKTAVAQNCDEALAWFSENVKTNDFPSDGLVAVYDDIAYGDSLGKTAKFPRNAIAFKWADEMKTTRLKEIEWSPSRTGLINPIAIFEPVELEGTTVSRASLHNVSVLRELKLGIGDEIRVYKANMIIPQIAENLTCSDNIELPVNCPACGLPTVLKDSEGIQTLFCTNEECPAKAIKGFSLFVSRDAMNIEGLSEATLEKLIGHGLIKSYADIFRLTDHKDAIVAFEGFGEKSYEKLISAVEKAKKTTLLRLLYGMGIPGIGLANAKVIVRYFDEDVQKITDASKEELCLIDSIGPVIATAYENWWKKETNKEKFMELLTLVKPEKTAKQDTNEALFNKTFVITGSLNHFANRGDLKELIENAGGKVSGSVSAKTDYLINNDVNSLSSKNKKALELGVKIISEDDFLKMIKR